MRICLLCEGSYPYVVGGVSSWVQMLMTGMPEHEFVLYCIGAEEKDRGNYKYKLEIDNDSIYANSQFNLIIEKANPNLIWEQNVGIMDVGQKLKLCYSTDYGNVRLTVEDPSIVTCSRNQVSEDI